jgi:Xaa-Pro aminopeptidase
MTSEEKLAHIRKEMARMQLDAYIIPSADPHMSEYLPDRWRIMAWLTGFTGSAGTVVITQEFAGVWTDSRYFLQAAEQLAGSGFELVKLKIPHTPEYIGWLTEHLPPRSHIGYDGHLVSLGLARRMERAFREKEFIIQEDTDPVTPLWDDRPPFPAAPAFEHRAEFAGRSIHEKISALREKMLDEECDVLLLTALDEVAWTFNIRGNDITYNPVVIAWGLIDKENAHLYIRPEKVPKELRIRLEALGVVLRDYDDITGDLSRLPAGSRLFLSPSSVNVALYRAIPQQVKIREGISPAARLKAVKNGEEIAHLREAMIKDGTALTKFFRWLEETLGQKPVTEVSAAARLEAFRAEEAWFHGPSFATISSFGPHGAVVHYTPDEQSDLELKAPGIYLVDSGGQYLDGTTDITRTIVLGEPTEQQKRDFTLVLKGTIDLAMARFPEGTLGHQLDILARHPLWNEGLNYGHGTGHGVGYFLNVHEGPQSINPGRAGILPAPLEEGMILSDEPGLYRDGEYGIRTENLVVIVKERETEYGRFFRFETLTLCYIDTRLIDITLLTEEERQWLNDYHRMVYEKLAPRLDEEHRRWLREKTKEM